jgi:hypothetical protein
MSCVVLVPQDEQPYLLSSPGWKPSAQVFHRSRYNYILCSRRSNPLTHRPFVSTVVSQHGSAGKYASSCHCAAFRKQVITHSTDRLCNLFDRSEHGISCPDSEMDGSCGLVGNQHPQSGDGSGDRSGRSYDEFRSCCPRGWYMTQRTDE